VGLSVTELAQFRPPVGAPNQMWGPILWSLQDVAGMGTNGPGGTGNGVCIE